MDQESSSTNQEEKKSRKPRYNAEEHVKQLEDQIDNLEKCLIKIASLSGMGNHLPEFGLSMWTPAKKDMKKYN